MEEICFKQPEHKVLLFSTHVNSVNVPKHPSAFSYEKQVAITSHTKGAKKYCLQLPSISELFYLVFTDLEYFFSFLSASVCSLHGSMTAVRVAGESCLVCPITTHPRKQPYIYCQYRSDNVLLIIFCTSFAIKDMRFWSPFGKSVLLWQIAHFFNNLQSCHRVKWARLLKGSPKTDTDSKQTKPKAECNIEAEVKWFSHIWSWALWICNEMLQCQVTTSPPRWASPTWLWKAPVTHTQQQSY